MKSLTAAIAIMILAVGIARASGDGAPIALDHIVLSDATTERSLADLAAGLPVIVHFWATWCSPCRDELPAIDRFRAELKARALADRLIVVSVDTRPYAAVTEFLAGDLGLPALPTWQDSRHTAGAALRLFGFPSTVLIDGSAHVTSRHAGAVRWDDPGVRAGLIAHITSGR